jgi:hypothetical protein
MKMKSIGDILREALKQAWDEGPVQISDEEFAAQQTRSAYERAQREARIRAEEQSILRRSGLPDMETFQKMTALSPRDAFAQEMRTTPERWLLDNPGSVDIYEAFGLKPPRIGDDVPLSPREQFIIANYMTPEAHAYRKPEQHRAAMAEFFGEADNAYTNERLS